MIHQNHVSGTRIRQISMIKNTKDKVKKTMGAHDAPDTSAIDAAIREIKTKFGDEAIMKLGDLLIMNA